MSRSGYGDYDCDSEWSLIMWRGAVKSALRGKRGKAFLIEMLTALDALPVKRLVANELVETEWQSISHWGLYEYESVCALGAVGKKRGVDMRKIDPEDSSTVAGTFDIADAMAREIVWVNDEGDSLYRRETPEQRFVRVRKWVTKQIGVLGQ